MLGTIVNFKGNDNYSEQMSQVVAILNSNYIISHAEGESFDSVFDSFQEPLVGDYNVLTDIDNDTRKFIMVELDDIEEHIFSVNSANGVDLSCYPYDKIPNKQKIYIHVLTGNKESLGDMILEGKLALVERSNYEEIVNNYKCLLKTIQIAIYSIAGIFDDDGKDIIANYINKDIVMSKENYMKKIKIGQIGKSFMKMLTGVGKNDLGMLMSKFDFTLFSEIDGKKLLDIGKQNNIPIGEFVEFLYEFNFINEEQKNQIDVV